MQRSLVITVIGPDRPGIVARLAAIAADCRASWQQSKMASLAGQFAGIVLLDVPAELQARLERSLQELDAEGLRLTIEHGATRAVQRTILLELVGHDRRGIVREISAVLTRHGVSIDELDTKIESASMSGEELFRASARLLLTEGTAIPSLRSDLEAIADELMVELSIDRE